MEEWKEYKLGEISDIQTGPFGSQLHKSDYVEEGIPCIMPTNIGQQLDIDVSNIAHINEIDANRLNRHLVKEGDIIYARRGDIEKCAYISEKENGWFCGTGCLRLRINENNNPHFIAYYLSTQECKKWIVGNAVGTTMLNLNSSILKELPLYLPSKKTQSKIASILKSLDDKIENNRKINENLEQQAQALFKSWFVDFEPFRDQPFVESELGMIPEGWRVGTLSEFGTIICGKTPSKANPDYYDGDYPFIKIPDMHGNIFPLKHEEYISEIGAQSQPNKLIPPFSLLVSCIATVGLVSINTVPSFTNQQINSIIVNNESSLYYLYLLLSEKTDELQNLGRGGTATLNVNTKIFSNIKVIIPSDNILILFNEITSPVFSKILNNAKESLRLSHLRDTLLPRLMSGELSVK